MLHFPGAFLVVVARGTTAEITLSECVWRSPGFWHAARIQRKI
jgi:hypothetical protein